MTHKISLGDELFRAEFEACTFLPKKFKHREHLRLAYIYLTEHDTEVAYQLMRAAIKKFLLHNKADPNVYHETITKAWILAVHHFMEKVATSDSSDSFINQYPVLLDSKIMMTHYSADLLFSEVARNRFVEPDLDPIPRYA